MKGKNRREARQIRSARVRRRLCVSAGRPRLSVFRSSRHMYAQIIDDGEQKTMVSASTRSKEIRGTVKKTNDLEAAKAVGKLLALRAREKNIVAVCFDRGPYLYHGRVKALAEAARAAGLTF